MLWDTLEIPLRCRILEKWKSKAPILSWHVLEENGRKPGDYLAKHVSLVHSPLKGSKDLIRVVIF